MSLRELLCDACASEALGYLASALVLAAFCMEAMVPLRVLALASNVAFIAYGVSLGLTPIWLLHLLLLAMNGCRLAQALRGRGARFPVRRPHGVVDVGELDRRETLPATSRKPAAAARG